MVHRFDDGPRKKGSPHWMWLLLIPYPAVLWVPFYNSVEPRVFGFPFFYAYQMGAVVMTAVLTFLVYLMMERRG